MLPVTYVINHSININQKNNGGYIYFMIVSHQNGPLVRLLKIHIFFWQLTCVSNLGVRITYRKLYLYIDKCLE